jgi:hypothetical protein
MPTWAELRQFLDARERPFRLRDDAALEHLHWASTRTRVHEDLTVLAIDHRSQFEEICRECGADPERIGAFKTLALRAVDRLAQGGDRFGVLLDGRYGMRALEAAVDPTGSAGRSSFPARARWLSRARRTSPPNCAPGRPTTWSSAWSSTTPTIRRSCANSRSASCCGCRTPAARPATSCCWR